MLSQKKLIIRSEKPVDFQEIYKVNQLAFGRANESELISLLRGKTSFDPRLSLIALINKNCVGYSLLFPLTPEILSLGPVAVSPSYQRQGIGGKLIKKGIQVATELNYSLSIVIGHPEYYPRFGFKKASLFNISSNYKKVPDEAFLVCFLKRSIDKKFIGTKITFPSEYKIAD